MTNASTLYIQYIWLNLVDVGSLTTLIFGPCPVFIICIIICFGAPPRVYSISVCNYYQWPVPSILNVVNQKSLSFLMHLQSCSSSHEKWTMVLQFSYYTVHLGLLWFNYKYHDKTIVTVPEYIWAFYGFNCKYHGKTTVKLLFHGQFGLSIQIRWLKYGNCTMVDLGFLWCLYKYPH